VTAHDGVHFSREGYFNLARNIGAGMDTFASERPQKKRQKQYFWRGFRSAWGSDKPSANANANTAIIRGRSWSSVGRRQFHPYKKN
jgi:hypothetical protein